MNDNEKSNNSGEPRIKAYKLIELARMYGVDRRTFLRWLDPFKKLIGKRNGDYYTVKQVEKIFKSLGLPDF